MNSFEVLKGKILEKRWGVIHFEISELNESENREVNFLLDSYVEGLEFHSIGSAWQEVNRPDARRIIVRILHADLAYDQELMSVDEAQALADKIIGLFSSNARFYTNGDLALKGGGWHPITNATFDTGVVLFDKSQIGLVWVEDED